MSMSAPGPHEQPAGPLLVRSGSEEESFAMSLPEPSPAASSLSPRPGMCGQRQRRHYAPRAFLIVRQRWATIAYYDKPKAYLYKVAVRLWHRYLAYSRRPATGRTMRTSSTASPTLLIRPGRRAGRHAHALVCPAAAAATHCGRPPSHRRFIRGGDRRGLRSQPGHCQVAAQCGPQDTQRAQRP